jgi:Uri superfamily endonuclease
MTPREPGSYVLIMELATPVTISVGQLGRFRFVRGWYAYAGSARGPGGLKARLRRHRRAVKAKHWHVDYLRAYAQPTSVWYSVGPQRRECSWAEALSELPRASMPAPRFGASDCRCAAHLFHFPTSPTKSDFASSVEVPVLEEVFDV